MSTVNVGARLSLMAAERPDAMAVAMPRGRDSQGRRQYDQLSFRELDEDSSRIAAGLCKMGAARGTRLALMVPQSIDFISLVFALLKAGAVSVLIDPGMGRRNLIRCLQEADVAGVVGIPLAQVVALLPWRFRQAQMNVTVGRRWWPWGEQTLARLRRTSLDGFRPADTDADDPAAVIFTTGSTGPPKGVLYRHGNFDQQADEIRDRYQIRPGEIDLPGFPLFALFNCVMGVGTVIPDMDPTRPADVDPRNIIEAAADWKVTQAFGSPALWNAVGQYCQRHGARLPTVRRVLSAGAPVPPHVVQRMRPAMHPEGEIHTPYGATEALPVASISGQEILEQTAPLTRQGRGVCVGTRFPGIRWKVIAVDDGPLQDVAQVKELPTEEIGELMVQGGVVTSQYVTRTECNALHKVRDGAGFWHRMGDLGYLDSQDRFWFCGRKSHRVQTSAETLYTIPCEAIFNEHPAVYRSALVGLGAAGIQQPVVIVEPWPEKRPRSDAQRQKLLGELGELAAACPLTQAIRRFLVHPSMPVDIRHNAKIFREQLAVWAARQLPLE